MAAPAALALALVLLAASRFPGPTAAMQVTLLNPYNVVILFQPVTLRCSYQTAATQPPIVTWKYKSYCRSRLADAFNPGGADSQLNSQLQQANPGYNPYVECQDSSRTVRVVATKQGNAVTLGEFYQGRRVTIVNAADLQLEQTAWGDSGVYYCTVTSAQDLEGNNEAFAELLVLDWLFVALVVLSAAALGLALGLCWCQCCPHRCCCFVRCPCCPRRCCCPEALYLAGKAATAGLPLSYGGAALTPVTLAPGALTPLGDGPRPGSAGGCSSQVPLLRDTDSVASSGQRSAGRRLQPGPGEASLRLLQRVERELAAFRPGAPAGPPPGSSARSEVSSLHEGPDAWAPDAWAPDAWAPGRPRSRSADDLEAPRPRGAQASPGPPGPRRPRSRDDLAGPRRTPGPPPGRRLRRNEALSRDSLVV